ncbi:MAG: VCBS repeat-containing protein [Bacteroidia bacterium]
MDTSNGPRFLKLDPAESGLDFVNQITEDSVYNALDFTNLYTGSGVGIGDINNDGLPDVFLGGCMNSSALFLNQGAMQFEEITRSAGLTTDSWITGVSMVDINQDGWLDIYLCVSGPAAAERKNLLFINQKDETFREEAAKYGLDIEAQCTQAAFFDYDKDGDLDIYLAVNPTDYAIFNVNTIRRKKIQGEAASTDLLYQNQGDGTFTNVSAESGILIEGYSLGLNVSDLNGDHWPDVYVTNDFLSNDLLYINQKDGTFRNEAATTFKHTSFASMGIDVADLNNDAKPEIYVVDMFPEDPYRQKMLMPGADHNRFRYILQAGYEPQYSRNTLQYNNGDGSYSDMSQLAGLHKSDWSWSPLMADFDNDGLRDIFIANGFLRDMGDLDYIKYNQEQIFGVPQSIRSRQLDHISKLKGIKLPNYLYHNLGDLQFENQSLDWGLEDSTYSNGAAYGDLDLDGDLDLVINNLNQSALLYQNQSQQIDPQHYVSLKLEGPTGNHSGLNTKVWLYQKEEIYFEEFHTNHGYESSMAPRLHFGLGLAERLDSIVLLWPDLNKQVWRSPKVDTLLILQYKATESNKIPQIADHDQAVFTAHKVISAKHEEDAHIDFNVQRLLPHEYTRLGPALAVADVDGDGREEMFLGGGAGYAGQLLSQNAMLLNKEMFANEKEREDIDALFLDVDGDGDQDLYVLSGGSVYPSNPETYQDRIYLNDGKGDFALDTAALPKIEQSGALVRAHDFDGDGDQDLLVGGRLVPGAYPSPPETYLLRNDGGRFYKIDPAHYPELSHIGMLTDAQWVQLEPNERWKLMIVGEWLAPQLFEWQGDKLMPAKTYGLAPHSGWWNCIQSGDFDGDGDLDFVAGNLGLNTNYRASETYPFCVYAKDFDGNGSIDPILCQYLNGREYPIASRDNLIQQITAKAPQFSSYHAFASVGLEGVFSKAELENALILKSQQLQTCYIENLGSGSFKVSPLDWTMQSAPIMDLWVEDINADGKLDLLAVGNSYATEVKTGRYDAFTGACLMGNGDGTFRVLRGAESGFLADKDARKIGKIQLQKDHYAYIVANNADSMDCFIAITDKNSHSKNTCTYEYANR